MAPTYGELLADPTRLAEIRDFSLAASPPASADDVANRFVEIDGARVQRTARHVDSGLLTILAQCGVGGLQALAQDGSWCSVPVCDDGLAVNFGGLMELWTGGRI